MPVSRRNAAKLNPPTEHPKPYQSPLWDHLETIVKLRRRRASWEAIAEHLNKTHGLNVSFQTVQRFLKRASDPNNPRKLKALPLGFEPNAAATKQAKKDQSSRDRLRAEAAFMRMEAEERETKWKFGSPYEATA
jgi:IS30 family transposase